MSDTLMQANSNWSSRPADERFQNIDQMQEVMNNRKASAIQFNMNPQTIQFVAKDNDILLENVSRGTTAKITNYGYKTMCTRLGVPYGFMEKLSADTVAAVMNDRHKALKSDSLVLAERTSSGSVIRAVSSAEYARVFDADIVKAYRPLIDAGWYNPIAFRNGEPESAVITATEADVGKYGGNGGVQVKVGDKVVPSGLYSSDRDMFMMLLSKNGEDDGFGRPLFSGIMVSHSEVYNRPFQQISFCCDGVCLNNICWGVTAVNEETMKHIGYAAYRIKAVAESTVRSLLTQKSNITKLREVIKIARGRQIAKFQDDVVDSVYKLKIDPIMTKALISDAIDVAEKFSNLNGNPYSVYGVFDGLTRISQKSQYQEDRVAIDMAASKLLAIGSK